MRSLLIALVPVIFSIACTKNDSLELKQDPATQISIPNSDTFPSYNGTNPIEGKWLIGKYARWCGNDSSVYENNNGNFIEFSNNDTAYYTYVTDNSRGISPYRVIDAQTILFDGKPQRIISIDENHFTLYYEDQNKWLREWFTLLKY